MFFVVGLTDHDDLYAKTGEKNDYAGGKISVMNILIKI